MKGMNGVGKGRGSRWKDGKDGMGWIMDAMDAMDAMDGEYGMPQKKWRPSCAVYTVLYVKYLCTVRVCGTRCSKQIRHLIV